MAYYGIWTSSDGINWTIQAAPLVFDWVAWADYSSPEGGPFQYFVAVNNPVVSTQDQVSTDGFTWTPNVASVTSGGPVRAVDPGSTVANPDRGVLSFDGTGGVWGTDSNPWETELGGITPLGTPSVLIHALGVWIALANVGPGLNNGIHIYTSGSPVGAAPWTHVTFINLSISGTGLATNGTNVVGVSDSPTFFFSTTPTTAWTTGTIAGANATAIANGGGIYVIVGTSTGTPTAWTSATGTGSWVSHAMGVYPANCITYSPALGLFVAGCTASVGGGSSPFFYSTNGSSWTASNYTDNNGPQVRDIAWSPLLGRFVAVGVTQTGNAWLLGSQETSMAGSTGGWHIG